MDTDTLERLRSRLEQARSEDQARLDEERLDALPMTARCREHAPTEAGTR